MEKKDFEESSRKTHQMRWDEMSAISCQVSIYIHDVFASERDAAGVLPGTELLPNAYFVKLCRSSEGDDVLTITFIGDN